MFFEKFFIEQPLLLVSPCNPPSLYYKEVFYLAQNDLNMTKKKNVMESYKWRLY